ncbi:MAG: hypothetical protein ACRD88_04480 [Terriglobia bacterium]
MRRILNNPGKNRVDTALNVVVLGAVATGVPWMIGLSLFDPLVLLPFSCLSVFFVAILTASAFAGESAREDARWRVEQGARPGEVAIKKAAATMLTGWVAGLIMMTITIGVVNYMNRFGRVVLPPADLLFATGAFSLGACAAVAGLGARISIGAPSLAVAQRTLRFTLMFVILAVALGARRFPGDGTSEGIIRAAWRASLALAAIGAALIGWAARRAQWSPTAPSEKT